MKMYLISDNIDTLTGMRLAGVEGADVYKRQIHNSGRYAQQELVIFDCNAFSDLNFANQVFDEETGIFCSRDITVCLKEISRLPYWLQLKLADNITLLENHNIRLIATTLEDLSKICLLYTSMVPIIFPMTGILEITGTRSMPSPATMPDLPLVPHIISSRTMVMPEAKMLMPTPANTCLLYTSYKRNQRRKTQRTRM